MRTCKKCGIEKNLSEFHKAKNCKDGYTPNCKECNNKRKHERGDDRGNKKKARNLLYRYNLSPEIIQLFLDGEILCMICKSNKNICVDHCHVTGKVRGFLCLSCNTLVGVLENNSINPLEFLDRLTKYMRGCNIIKQS